MPRFVFWTIVLGPEPTAFRAKERDELLPTLKQLQRHHPEATLKFFARGQLWDSAEAATEARDRERDAARARPHAWRPGGDHRDPREEYKKPREQKRREMARKFGWKKEDDPTRGERGRERRDSGERGEPGDGGHQRSRPQGDRKPWSDRPPRRDDRRPSGDRPPRPQGDRKPWSDRPPRRDDDRRPSGDRPPRSQGDRKPWSDRSKGPDGGRRQGPTGPPRKKSR
jgi:hypothetical protein